MTPKEKAVELYNKYRMGVDEYGYQLCEFTSCARKCAFIAVDEIIQSDDNEHPSDIKIEFWEQVKKEIELL